MPTQTPVVPPAGFTCYTYGTGSFSSTRCEPTPPSKPMTMQELQAVGGFITLLILGVVAFLVYSTR